MLRLTALLGRGVVDAEGERIGELEDLGVLLGEAHPRISMARVKAPGGAEPVGVAAAEPVDEGLAVDVGTEPAGEVLLLRRHVLDTQVINLDGHRLVRVGDVLLGGEAGHLRLMAVEVGTAPVLRRLGLDRLARVGGDERMDWDDLHLASAPGHVLQLRAGHGPVHRLSQAELEDLASALPPARARELRRHFGLPRPPHVWRRHLGRRFGSVLRARSSAPR